MSTSTANPHPTRNGRGSDADKYRIVQHRNNIADTIKRNLQLWGCSVFIYVRMFIGSCDVTTKQFECRKMYQICARMFLYKNNIISS
jgi:hypothetical protein